MATVLPGSPPPFNRNDVEGTVKALCSYSRNLQDNLDFMLGQLKRNMETVQADISAQKQTVQSMSNTISGLQNSLATLGSSLNALTARVAALEQNS